MGKKQPDAKPRKFWYEYRKGIGDIGEKMACEYLRGKGYEILGRQVRTPHGELDIVSRKEGVYHFIEVKTRRNVAFQSPLESLTLSKHRRWYTAVMEYVSMNGLDERLIQGDFIAIELRDEGDADIKHLEAVLSEC